MKRYYGIFLLSFLLWGCSEASPPKEKEAGGENEKHVTLEEWGGHIDDMVFQNKIRLGQIEIRFKNGTRLVEFSPRHFVIMGSGMETCQAWMQWAQLRKTQWVMQLSVRGEGKFRCPVEDMFTMSFQRTRDRVRPPDGSHP